MKTEEQIRALAKLDGKFGDAESILNQGFYDQLPKYLTSYDAILSLLHKQSDTRQYQFFIVLSDVVKKDIQFTYQIFRATPAQMCEALLRVEEVWKD